MKFLMREFYKHFPVPNKLGHNRGFDGCLFGTDGAEFEFVASQPDEKVWTMVDDNGYAYLINGLVRDEDVLGYFVMEKAWTENHEIAIPTS